MNRWDSLTLQQKNQLLGIYASKGYTDLASIISHYNSFATGGQINTEEPDNPKKVDAISGPAKTINLPEVKIYSPRSDKENEWLKWWYSNRRNQIKNTYKKYRSTYSIGDMLSSLVNSDKIAEKYTNNFLSKLPEYLDNLEEHTSSDNRFVGVNNASNAYKDWLINTAKEDIDFGNINPKTIEPRLIAERLGEYYYGTNGDKKYILYRDNPTSATIIHERTHNIDDFGKSIRGNLLDIIKRKQLKPGYYTIEDDIPSELYSRLNALRYDTKVDPNHTYTIEEIRDLKNHPNYNEHDLDLDRYTDEFLLHLFNDVAQNNSEENQDDSNIT